MRNLKILVLVRGGMGDMIEGTPLCHALHLLGHEIDLYLDVGRPELMKSFLSGWPVLGNLYTQVGQVDFLKYDLSILCQGNSPLYKEFPVGLCADVRFHDLLVHQLSDREANLRVARFLGYEGPVPPGHVEKSERIFELRPNTVVVHAGCGKIATRKRWGHWPEICSRLETAGYPVVIVGTDMDRSDENWEANYQTEFNLPLPDLVSLINRAAFYLGNDSGVGHIAAALGVPGLILFGISDPRYFAPNSTVLKPLALVKGPTQTKSSWATTQTLITLLNVQDVWREIEQLLANPSLRDPPRILPPMERKYPPVLSCPQFQDDPPETRIYKKASHSLLSVFSDSARKLMQGQDRKTVAAEAKRTAGQIHIMTSFQLLKLRLSPGVQSSMWPKSKGLLHARRGMRAGYILSGSLLYLLHYVMGFLIRH